MYELKMADITIINNTKEDIDEYYMKEKNCGAYIHEATDEHIDALKNGNILAISDGECIHFLDKDIKQ